MQLKTGSAGDVELWIEEEYRPNHADGRKRFPTLLVAGAALLCLTAALVMTMGESHVPKVTPSSTASNQAVSQDARVSPEISTACDDERQIYDSVVKFLAQLDPLTVPPKSEIEVTEISRSTIGAFAQVQIVTNCPKFAHWQARTSSATKGWSVKKNHPAEPFTPAG